MSPLSSCEGAERTDHPNGAQDHGKAVGVIVRQAGRPGPGRVAPSSEERVRIEDDDRRREQPDLHRHEGPARQHPPDQQGDDQDDRGSRSHRSPH